ncbi:winged helix-turn-helix domain-containing protein [Thiocystis minor]|uniref:winged helix-turn-helix domain-containing protein n=1 Tax=Thiocystis minor TaxID=61597 RepID=UPI001F5CB236|nr:winged helix-turn-helix domain-containing protein [Thiocystis minor]
MEKTKGSNFLRFCIPILETLQELGGSGQPKEVTDAVLERLQISEQEQAQMLKSGGSRVRNQVAWARLYLAKADLLDASRRGVWALTEKGRTTRLSSNAVTQLFKEVRANFPTNDAQINSVDDSTEITQSMDLSGETGSKRTLLDVLKSLSPGGFERVS